MRNHKESESIRASVRLTGVVHWKLAWWIGKPQPWKNIWSFPSRGIWTVRSRQGKSHDCTVFRASGEAIVFAVITCDSCRPKWISASKNAREWIFEKKNSDYSPISEYIERILSKELRHLCETAKSSPQFRYFVWFHFAITHCLSQIRKKTTFLNSKTLFAFGLFWKKKQIIFCAGEPIGSVKKGN